MALNNSWLPKVLALVAAIVLWIFVMNEQNPLAERVVSLPVAVESLDSDQQIVMNSIPNVQVKIRAPRLQLAEFSDNDLKAMVDVNGQVAGTHMIPIQITTPRGIEIVEMSSSSLEIILDDLITRQVPVRVQVEGTLHADFQIQEIQASPVSVTITGPASEQEFAKEVLASISVNGAVDSISAEAVPTLAGGGELSSHWRISPSKVAVSATIMKKESRDVAVELQTSGSLPEGLRIADIRIEPAEVNLQGSSTSLSRIDKVRTEPINLNEIRTNGEWVKGLELPAEVVGEPQKVKIVIQVESVRAGN